MMQTYEFGLKSNGPGATVYHTAHAWAASEAIARRQVEAQYAPRWTVGVATILPGVRAGINCEGCD